MENFSFRNIVRALPVIAGLTAGCENSDPGVTNITNITQAGIEKIFEGTISTPDSATHPQNPAWIEFDIVQPVAYEDLRGMVKGGRTFSVSIDSAKGGGGSGSVSDFVCNKSAVFGSEFICYGPQVSPTGLPADAVYEGASIAFDQGKVYDVPLQNQPDLLGHIDFSLFASQNPEVDAGK